VDFDSPAVPDAEPTHRASATREIKVGDSVRLLSFGSVGIVDKLNGDEAEVRVKSLRFREKVANLERVEAALPPPQAGRGARLHVSRGTEFRLSDTEAEARAELNLIGRTTDEAVDETDKFLDEAFLHSMNHVRIVHGHGTGALRKAIARLLNGHPHVARFSAAPPDQGGAGATLVELRQ
jgi:DNA mismatch repair protein MutS2